MAAEQTEKSFPFDAEEINGEHDRKYLAEDFTRYFRAFISSGTFMKESTNLQVMSNGDMTVTLMPGSMMIEGTRYDNTQSLVFELTPADGVLNRIDRISIVYDKQQRDIHAEVLEGEPSYEPVPQRIRRTEEYKDYITADIYVAAGVVSIQQSDITDQRLNSEVCGIAVPFTEIDTTTIFNQFLDWFEQIKSDGEKDVQQLLDDLRGLLDEDVAVHLQSEIDKINEEMKNKISSKDVVDHLESTATDLPVSANTVRELKESLTKTEFAEITKISNSNANIALESSYACLKDGVCYLNLQMIFSTLSGGWVNIGKLPVIPDTNGVEVFTLVANTMVAKEPTATWLRISTDGTIKIIPNGTAEVVYTANVSFPYKILI